VISLDKEYMTRDGRKVRLLCVDGPDSLYPVVGFVECSSDTYEWCSDGKFRRHIDVDRRDLIESKPRLKKTLWLHHYKDGRSSVFSNPVTAGEETVARTKHEIDVEHGHGLGDANE